MDAGRLYNGIQKEQPINYHERSDPQALAWSFFYLIGNGVKLFLTVDRQVGPFGQVLANQPIGVLVAASLPRTVWIAKVPVTCPRKPSQR